jgi:hypothetical protein
MARYSRERSKIGTLRPGGLRFGALGGRPPAAGFPAAPDGEPSPPRISCRGMLKSADFMPSRPAGTAHAAMGGAAQQEVRDTFLPCLPRS